MKQALLFLLSGLCLYADQLHAQAAPPDRPGRPDLPIIERQTERQVERVLRQTERMSRQLPDPAVQALERAQSGLQKALDRQLSATNNRPDLSEIKTEDGQVLFVESKVEHGWQAIQREWVLLLTPEEMTTLRTEVPQLMQYVVEHSKAESLDYELLKLQVPQQLDSYQAIASEVNANLFRFLDRNHLYQAQTQQIADADTQRDLAHQVCDGAIKIGLIDTALQQQHTAFLQAKIVGQRFTDKQLRQPLAHGTAVASLLVGHAVELMPLLPKAQLYHASVFYQDQNGHQASSLFSLLKALDWLVEQQVAVINMSLTGPHNAVLKRAVDKVISKGSYIVAATGNAGPSATPLFPAAYENVLAVTAVDEQQRIYRRANRGEHVDFAARGVSITVADAAGGFKSETGTSMAAPVVAALLACELVKQNGDFSAALASLIERAEDLGEPGQDVIYGYGVLKPDLHRQP